MSEGARAGLTRLELRVERLKVTFRFTFAFHAREIRFERDDGEGFQRVFPETFPFHRERHDPTELSLQLDDLLTKPRLLGSRAHTRDSTDLVTRLLSQAPRYIERVLQRLESDDIEDAVRVRIHQDVALLCQLMLRFIETRDLMDARPVRVAGFLLRKLIYRSLMVLVDGRVDPVWLERWLEGEVEAVEASDDPS